MNFPLDKQALDRQDQRRARRHVPGDPLAERERLIGFWTQCAETNRSYLPHKGCWCWTFYYMNPTWRKLVMPRVRLLLDERDRQKKKRLAKEMREYSERSRLAKEARARAKKLAEAPLPPLFAALQEEA